MGDRRAHLSNLLTHVIDGSAVVVSVEYRLASEHPDPAPVEDCYAGLARVSKNAAELGIDPERLMITGISGGGGDRAARPRRRMGAEGFRDEILIYAGRLSEAGVSVDPHMWAGGFHSFDMIAGQAAVPRASIATREEFIRRALDA